MSYRIKPPLQAWRRIDYQSVAEVFADNSPRSTDNAICSLRSGLRSDGLAIVISTGPNGAAGTKRQRSEFVVSH